MGCSPGHSSLTCGYIFGVITACIHWHKHFGKLILCMYKLYIIPFLTFTHNVISTILLVVEWDTGYCNQLKGLLRKYILGIIPSIYFLGIIPSIYFTSY